MFVGVVTLHYQHHTTGVVLITQCHNFHKHNHSSLTKINVRYYIVLSSYVKFCWCFQVLIDFMRNKSRQSTVSKLLELICEETIPPAIATSLLHCFDSYRDAVSSLKGQVCSVFFYNFNKNRLQFWRQHFCHIRN